MTSHPSAGTTSPAVTPSVAPSVTPDATPGSARSPVPGGAVAAVAGAVLLAATNALFGAIPGTADAQSTEDAVGVVAASPGLFQGLAALGLASTALLVPGIWAVSASLAARSPKLAGLGGWVMATAYVFSMALHVETLVMLAVAASDVDPAAYGAASDEHATVVSIVMYAVFGIGAFLGSILLGAAMLRQSGARGEPGGVPRWAGWLLIASVPMRIAGLAFGVAVGPPLASLMVAAAFTGALFLRRR